MTNALVLGIRVISVNMRATPRAVSRFISSPNMRGSSITVTSVSIPPALPARFGDTSSPSTRKSDIRVINANTRPPRNFTSKSTKKLNTKECIKKEIIYNDLILVL